MAKDKETERGVGHRYDAESITVLEGLEPVRKRPGMYIGSTGPDGLNHLMVEIFDNSRDEAMNGHCTEIEVALLPGDQVRVVDNGRGIPVDIHKKTKVSALETVMTTLHAGGKFGGDDYKISGGLHGVGASVVNALSSWLKAEVHQNGGKYAQEYKTGKKQYAVKKVGPSKLHGTVITWQSDATIFSEVVYDWERVINHLRGQAYLVKNLRIRAIDARGYEGKIDLDKIFWLSELKLEVPSKTFYFEGGLVSLIKFYNQHDKPIQRDVFYVDKEANNVQVEVALQYIDDIDAKEVSYTNNTVTPEGGMHVTGFRTALTRTLNDYARKNGYSKDSEENFTGDDVREGMTAVISVKMRDPQFEGQTKGKLGSVEARGAVETVFGEAFALYLEEHPEDAKQVISKSILAQKARKAAKAAKDSILRKGALEGMTLPGKLADCQSRNAEESEVFIVEGDSAGGCWDGDTEVALTDGRNLSFKKLVSEDKQGKKNYCYTLDDNGSVKIAEIKDPRLTKKAAEVIKVVLDNDEKLVCTPDHKFRLADGSYVEAQKLTTEMNLAVHKESVKFVETKKVDEKIDVYDLEVEGTHNFALASGVFVHNSAKQGRDRRIQAILPLKGKILNVEKARLDKMLAFAEIKALIIAMGVGIGDQMDLSKLRYYKMIIATDADVDGAHIRTLLLTFFFRYYPQLIDDGRIFIAQPPLYKLKKGKEQRYAYSDEEKNRFVKEMGGETVEGEEGEESETEEEDEEVVVKKASKISIQRYKGLGEMNPDELWETTMRPETRVLKQVHVEDAEKADQTFDILMGHEVEPRKIFIQTHAKLANLDV
ncbi:MAG: ATP-binding protein [Candidatus Vogelbacteria bacterium]|nr:ATP-binding protein [Candidatus Vogelbacteria bacterium]